MQQELALQKSDFPQIMSSTQNQAVILTRINPETEGKFFICAQDIIDGVAGDKSSLQTYEEFCHYLQEPNILPGISEDDHKKGKDFLKSQRQNQQQFLQRIETEKLNVKRLLTDKLQELYRNKCGELVIKLQEELEQQNRLFVENYEKLGKELAVDREREAGLQGYEEVRKKVKEMKDPKEIEDFLEQSYKQKTVWKNASNSIQTLGPRSEKFYMDLIQKQLATPPTLSNTDKVVETWVNGLDKLISSVKADANIFKNILCTCDLLIPLQLNSIKELSLLTNEMLKQDTQLIIQIPGVKITEQQMGIFISNLQRLPNLRHLVFNITGGNFPFVEDFSKAFEKLQQLKTIEIKAFGIKLGDQGVSKLLEFVQYVPQLEGISLQLSNNKLSTQGIIELAQQINKLKNLQWIYLKLGQNQLKPQGIDKFCEILSPILSKIICMSLDFQGSCEKNTNRLDTASCASILKMIQTSSNLKHLKLNLGQNSIDNQIFHSLSILLNQLPSLNDFTLNLQNNKIDSKGARKLAKILLNNKFCGLNLNLAGNLLIKQEGANCIIAAVRTMELLSKVQVNLRNTGIVRGCATQMRSDMEKKQGRGLEKMVFLA